MANRLKKKEAVPNPDELKQEKEETVTVQEVIQDERTYKLYGALSLLFSLFLFVAFTSYLFTWQEDQDKVHQLGIKIFSTEDVGIQNLLGVLGAYASHIFFFKGFGIASYLICTFFFVMGVNLLTTQKIFSLKRNLRYVTTGLIVISIFMAFLGAKAAFPWGGAVGEMMNAWLIKWVGKFGTGAIIFIVFFGYIIWRFNPTFKWPDFKSWFSKNNNIKTTENYGTTADETDADVLGLNDASDAETSLAKNLVQPPVSNNKLKSETGSVVVLMPKQEEEENPLTEFGLVEKEAATVNEMYASGELEETIPNTLEMSTEEEEEIVEEEDASNEAEEIIQDDSEVEEDGLALEIKEFSEEEDEEVTHFTADTKYEPTLDLRNYKYPGIDLLETHGSEKIVHDPQELETNKNQIINTLKNYDISIQRISATVGPTVTLYEIVPAPGVRISRIKNLEDDIALSLAALGIRIIAPIPGKGTIGIEVPNATKRVVSMKTLLASEKFQNSTHSLPIAIGKKIDNENFIVDLASMPHLLMAGATGQGKSVGLNAILVSLLYKKHPSQLKFVLVDPKKVELSLYRVIEKHFLAKLPGEEEAIITDTKKVIYTLNALCIEMDNRYDLLKEAGCRNIKEYNEKFTNRKLNPQKGHQYMPFIVLVVDEFADLIMTAGKEVEMPIARLAQLARAVGIHLIIATQRPSVNIITGTIKANFPARVAFKVSSKIDSRTILDAGGADQLIGKGDMLVSYNGDITRLQCAFVDTPEVERICEFIGKQQGYPQAFMLPEYVDEKDVEGREVDLADRDSLFEDAARLIVQNQMGSTSLIQRRMKLGYNRAGRLMDQLEMAGVVGPNQGSKARDVLIKTEAELDQLLNNLS